jgi:hypothetical protein
MAKRSLSMSICTAATLSCAFASQASAQASFVVTCDITENTHIVATGSPPGDQAKSYTQTFRVDPATKTITLSMSVDQSSGEYRPITTAVTDVRSISDSAVVFCAEERHSCQVFTDSTARWSSEFKHSLVTLDLAGLKVGYDSYAKSSMSNGARLMMNTQASGACHRA